MDGMKKLKTFLLLDALGELLPEDPEHEEEEPYEETDHETPGEGHRQAPLPPLSGVVYTDPNQDGTRKLCGNCAMYATEARQCYIHDVALAGSIGPTFVCGYHTYAPEPLRRFTLIIPLTPVRPDLSGLVDTEAGASCDLCLYYAGDRVEGVCVAVAELDGTPARVAALGCCARWTPALLFQKQPL